MNNDELEQHTPEKAHSSRLSVMDAIKKGTVTMRPRWHFILLSTLAAVGAFIVLLALVYIASLLVFFMHDSGAWFVPSFGGRGWFSFLRSIPWLLIFLIGIFALILEVLVRRMRSYIASHFCFLQ